MKPLQTIKELLTGGGLSDVIGKFVTDRDAAIRLEAELTGVLANAQRDIIVAEAQGQSWLQRNWRPLLMVVFMLILVNNFILVPYVQAFGATVPSLPFPNGAWALLNVSVGGYIAGRSGEKIMETWKGEK